MSDTVLIIEDNEQNIYLMNFLLEKNGFKVLQAMDGPTGIQHALSKKVDLILLDIQLPGMNGYEVAKILRENDSLNHIPIIAVTSYAMPGDREKALKSGCTGYIEKPINPATFLSEMQQYRT